MPLSAQQFKANVTRDTGPPSSTIAAVATIGALVGALLIFIDAASWSANEADLDSPGFFLWFTTMCAQTAAWPIALIFVCRSLKALSAFWRGHEHEVIQSLAMFVVLLAAYVFIVFTVLELANPVPHYEWKGAVLAAVGFAVALGGLAGIFLVQAGLDEAFYSSNSDTNKILALLRLRDHLQRLLNIEGGVLGGAILGAGAHRFAVVSSTKNSAEYPAEWILTYGAFLTMLLVLAYAPTNARLMATGRSLRDRCFPFTATMFSSRELSEWYEDRKTLDEILGLTKTTTETLRTTVAIFTPLTTGVLGSLLGAGTA